MSAEPRRRPSIELDSLRLTVAAGVSMLVFCCGLAWAARGIVADVRIEQMAAESRILAAIDARHLELANRVLLIEARLGIRGAAVVAPAVTMPASNGD